MRKITLLVVALSLIGLSAQAASKIPFKPTLQFKFAKHSSQPKLVLHGGALVNHLFDGRSLPAIKLRTVDVKTAASIKKAINAGQAKVSVFKHDQRDKATISITWGKGKNKRAIQDVVQLKSIHWDIDRATRNGTLKLYKE